MVAVWHAAVRHQTAGLNTKETPWHCPRGPPKMLIKDQSYFDKGTKPHGSTRLLADIIPVLPKAKKSWLERALGSECFKIKF
jgi:hypothetical protein